MAAPPLAGESGNGRWRTSPTSVLPQFQLYGLVFEVFEAVATGTVSFVWGETMVNTLCDLWFNGMG